MVESEPAWWKQPFRTFQTNLREIDAGLDVSAVLDHLEDIGANTWLLNTAGIVSFYPSQLEFQHPSPWLSARKSGDLVGDAVEAAHSRGVRVVSRIDFSKVYRDIAERHPDWCFVGVEGGAQIYNGLYSTCPSGPYYQHRSFDIIEEILARYPVDGFFFNWFGFNQYDYSRRHYGVCQCGNCARRFMDHYGSHLPQRDRWDDPAHGDWTAYTRWTLEDLARRIRALIKERSPTSALMLHYDPDVVFYEANNAVDRPQPLWLYATGEFVRRSRASAPDKPVWVNSVMFIDMPYRFIPEQPGMLGLYFVQTIAHGGNPSAYMAGTPDLFGDHDFDIVRDIFGFHQRNEQYYANSQSAARVALIASQATHDHYRARNEEHRTTHEARGVYRALIESHIPFDIIRAESLPDFATSGRLATYSAVVLPNIAVLTDEERQALDQYVAAGGGLVATNETASIDPDGTRRDQLGLASIGHAQIVHRRTNPETVRSSYLQVRDPDLLPGVAGSGFILVDREFLQIRPDDTTQPLLSFVPPDRYGPPEKCYWDVAPTEYPGMVRHSYRQGSTSYFPWPIGALYYDLSVPEHRRLLVEAIRSVSATAVDVETNAPPHVEIVVSRQPDHRRTLIHLINYSGHQYRAIHDPLEIRDIDLGLVPPYQPTKAHALRLGRELSLSRSGDRVRVELPRLGLFEVITLEE